ncbi:hypothetical protein RB594_008316 [Gaeumannomyces avenae]
MSGSSSTTSTARRMTRDEEKASLLRDDKTLSGIESDAGRAEIETRFPHASRARSWLAAVGACAGNKLIRAPPWRTAAVRAIFFLVPSFLRHSHGPAAAATAVSGRDFRHSRTRIDRLGPTSYLDGMRGVAAFVVFLCHYFYTCFRIAEGWGYNGNDSALTLPVLRLWYQGPPMVAVFFVVSGYALSIKPLRLARAAAARRSRRPPSTPSLQSSAPSPSEEFSATLSSFIFRRFFRLFLPTAASTLMVVVLLRMGVYEWTRDFAHDERFMRNVQEMHPERLGSLALQLQDWARAMFEFVHVWDWEPFGGSTAYDVHLWTIPVEFRCSMVLFATLVGVGRLRSWIRLLVLAILVLFCYRSGRWDMFLFYCGAVLAELDLIRDAETDLATTAIPAQPAGDRPGGDPHRQRRRRACASLWWWRLVGFATLYLMSQPDFGADETPGWVFLSGLVPDCWADDGYRHWQSVGAVLFVAVVARLPGWQALFNLAPARYLGRVSYALYLVHGPVLHTTGYLIEMRTFAITTAGGQMITDWGYVAGFALGAAFIVPIVVWAADVFWRAVDAPVVRFARRLEAVCSV